MKIHFKNTLPFNNNMIKDWDIITRRVTALARIRSMIIDCKTQMIDWQLNFKFVTKWQLPCIWLKKSDKEEIPFCLLPDVLKKPQWDPTTYSWTNDLKIIIPWDMIHVIYKYKTNTLYCHCWKRTTEFSCVSLMKDSTIQDIPFFTFLWHVKNA